MLFRRTEPAAKSQRGQGVDAAPGPQKIISLHFPKAAGTSMKSQFAALLGDGVHMDYSHDPLTSPRAAAVAFPEGKRVVHGHFRADRYAAGDAYMLTFLREPVDNLISIYFYWRSFRKPAHDLHARFLRDKPSVVDFATYPGIQRLMSETYFGGFDMRRFDFIGFHDNRDRDIRSLAGDLHLDLSASVRDNTSRARFRRFLTALDRSTMHRVKRHLADDIDFYELMATTRRHGSASPSRQVSESAATANV